MLTEGTRHKPGMKLDWEMQTLKCREWLIPEHHTAQQPKYPIYPGKHTPLGMLVQGIHGIQTSAEEHLLL